MIRCGKCVQEMPDGVNFCPNCGAPSSFGPVAGKPQPKKPNNFSGCGTVVLVLVIVSAVVLGGIALISNTATSRSRSKPASTSEKTRAVDRDRVKKQKEARRAEQEKKLAPRIQSLRDTGFLTKFNIDLNQAWVEPSLWHALNYDTKQGIAATLAAYCDARGSQGYVNIIDNRSGKKLAKYSSWGFTVY